MADLYIRWTSVPSADVGVRPISPCWPPNAFWTNASIWMEYPPNYPDPTKRGTTALRARIGEEVIINVAAYSKQATFPFPSDQEYVHCQIWVCTGANGVGPVSALPSAGGAAGMSTIVFGTIDTSYPGVASALWTPAATDNLPFDPAGAAHVCIAANLVYPASTTATPRGQGQYLPQFVSSGQHVETIFPCGDGPIDPRSNVQIGHFHGQKNIQVLAADAAELTASLRLFAIARRRKRHVLELTERPGRRLIPTLRESLLAHSAVALVGGATRERRVIEVRRDELELIEPKLRKIVRATKRWGVEPFERAQLAGGGRLVLAQDENIRLRPSRRPLDNIAILAGGTSGTTLEVEVDPKESQELLVDLRAAQADPAGIVRAFDLAERDQDGGLIGGTTFVTLAAG